MEDGLVKTAIPERFGFSSERLTRIDRVMQGYVDGGRLAGLITTVACRGETVHLSKYGMMDIEAGKPMTFDALFRIMSLTKPVTSVAMMMLYEEGHFHLNTPIYEFISEFKDTKVLLGVTPDGLQVQDLQTPITFRHLFTHTSGLSYGWDPDDPVDQIYRQARQEYREQEIDPTLKDIVLDLASAPLAFQPGTEWRYSLSVDVLGYVVEVISGMSLDAYFQSRIFDPLGMVDTGFWVPRAKVDRLTVLYGHLDGAEELSRPESAKQFERFEKPAFLSGGGGLMSTVPDYTRFSQMMVNGGELDGARLLSPTTVALYSMNHAPSQVLPYGSAEYDNGYGYSLGTRVLMDVARTGVAGSVGEFGWGGAFSTYFWIDPAEELYGLLMTQHTPNNYYPIATQFKQLTYQAMIG